MKKIYSKPELAIMDAELLTMIAMSIDDVEIADPKEVVLSREEDDDEDFLNSVWDE